MVEQLPFKQLMGVRSPLPLLFIKNEYQTNLQFSD